MMKTLGFAAVLLTSLAVGLVALPGSADAQGSPLGPVKITHDKIGQAAVAAGSPVVFTATGKVAPHEGQEQSWIVFVWDFGDDGTDESGTLFGTTGIQHQSTHVFAAPGVYTVRCTAGHGPDSGGHYKFERTTTLKVTVACSDTAPGPKKCGPVRFAPFTGVWDYSGGESDRGTLTLADDGASVTGTLSYSHREEEDEPSSTSYWVVKGSTLKLGRGPNSEGEPRVWLALVLDLKPASAPLATAPKPAKAAPPRLLMQLTYDKDSQDYRSATGAIDLPEFGSTGGFTLIGRTADKSATICTLVNAGRKKTTPGGLLAFTVAVQNEGPACLPTGRVGLTIEVEGATIVEQSIQPTRVVATGSDARHLLYTLSSLGKGKKADGRAAVAFVVRTNDDAGEVKCRVTATANGLDAYTDVVLPPDRVICVPVERK
jgi:hypothetical protein